LKLPNNLQEAVFVTRPNRFSAVFDLNGRRVTAHVANSGRMRELMIPGTRMFLAQVSSETRKTAYDLTLVQIDGVLVSVDARLPLPLVHEAITEGRMPQLQGYKHVKREAVYRDSRFDLLLSGPKVQCYVETKSITLVEEGVGLFPDAPTERGRKHVEGLAQAIREGHRGAVVFVVQRDDATSFAPNDKADPKFGNALRKAISEGVEAYAYRCSVSKRQISIQSQIPIRL